jgi:hypothetical protein
MPDQFGRPTMGDWIAAGNAFGRGVEQMNDMQDRRRALETRERVQGYLNKMARGEKIDPSAPDYQYMDHLAASAIAGRQAMADENLRATRLENDKKAAEANQEKINAAIGAARESYFKAQKEKDPEKRKGFENQAYDALLPAYAFIPDGGKFVRWKDKARTAMVFSDMRGKEIEQPTPSLDQAMSMAVTASDKYVQMFANTRDKVRSLNMEQIIKASTDPSRRMRSSSGREAVYVPAFDMNDSGEMVLRQTWSDPRTGKVLKGFDPATGKEVKSSLDFRPETYWKTVSSLGTDERKAWDSAVVAASKAWNTAVKEGQVDPQTDDADAWQRDYAKAYYLRLRPGAKLPAGFENDPGAGADNWQNYVQGMGGDGLIASHSAGDYTQPAQEPAAPQSAGIVPDALAASHQPVKKTPAVDEAPNIRKELPENPAAWNVQETTKDGRVVPVAAVTLPTGEVKQIELTAEEYVYWLVNKDKDRGGTVKDVVKGITDYKARKYAEAHKGAKGPKGIRTY